MRIKGFAGAIGLLPLLPGKQAAPPLAGPRCPVCFRSAYRNGVHDQGVEKPVDLTRISLDGWPLLPCVCKKGCTYY
jgi:hypothetical protein